LQEVEGGALGREQGAGLGVDFAERLAGGNQIAVAGVPADDGERVERGKQALNQAVPASTASSRLMTLPCERRRR
jgi:hypothetical protein